MKSPEENDRIESALQSLDKIERATANPFLYGKIHSRMQSSGNPVMVRWAWRLVGVLTITTLVNIVVLWKWNTPQQVQESGTAEAIAKDYSIEIAQPF